MKSSTSGLILSPDASIDLHIHTHYSDGTWTPDRLLDHLEQEAFALVAITDHDRVDTVKLLQQLANERQVPVLAAVEMTTSWRGEMTDVLCYGFDPEKNELDALAQNVARRQRENTREVYENLQRSGYRFPRQLSNVQPDRDELTPILEKPSAQQPHELGALVKRYGYGTSELPAGKILLDAGVIFATNDLADVVDAAHRSGAVCLIAHPGRGDGFTCFDLPLLKKLRSETPVDGLEVYYPAHTPEQIVLYRDYAQKHDLLIGAGSDSHGLEKKPIKYRAGLSRRLLEKLGVQVG